MDTSISIIIPMYNAELTIGMVLDAVFRQDYGGLVETIVIDDGSKDSSLNIVERFLNTNDLKIIRQSNAGAVSATNKGFKEARHEIICNVDSDVVLQKDWLKKIIEEFDDPRIGAVHGYFETPKTMPLLARIAGYDLEERYSSIKGKYVTQVSTGNTAYRKIALDKVGLFDPRFKYGYDNDMSYRLIKAGYLLVLRKDAICYHYWKTKSKDYLKQQYWSAYGRMQLLKKHKDRFSGDSVSGVRMILQVPLTLLIILFFVCGVVFYLLFSNQFFLQIGFSLLIILLFDRILFSLRTMKRKRDFGVTFMPFFHLLRNIVWTVAFIKWFFDTIKDIKKQRNRQCV